MKTFLSKTFAMWFKRLGFAGALRWRILYWTYKLWPGLHIRDAEWDWILNYLPRLDKWQNVRVLDVGASSSLFIYEIVRRGYHTWGMDIRPYQEKPGSFRFLKSDITKYHLSAMMDFVVCISVLEHIPEEKQKDAFDNMIKCLKPGGRLLLTIPTREFSQGHEWEGFTYGRFVKMLPDDAWVLEYTERKGQLCLAIERRNP